MNSLTITIIKGVQIYTGNCFDILPTLPEQSVHCCVTSPPYWGLRDYGHDDQLGLEDTPEAYVANLVEVFRDVWRVLRDDGTLWLNLGDCYANDGKWGGSSGGKHVAALHGDTGIGRRKTKTGLKPKDLIGIPWMMAFALRADGWYLRKDIIWCKPNGMRESVMDRPTSAHEHLFLMSKSERYYYDYEAVKVPNRQPDRKRADKFGGSSWQGRGQHSEGGLYERGKDKQRGHKRRHEGFTGHWDKMTKQEQQENGANLLDWWEIATCPFPDAHFATFPPKLIEPCIIAGCPERGIVLDPFAGVATTGLVAIEHRRQAILCELNPEYVAMGAERLRHAWPLPTQLEMFIGRQAQNGTEAKTETPRETPAR